MKWWRRAALLALLLMIAMIAVLVLPRPAAKEEPMFLIGLSQANLVEPWRVAMNLEFEEAATQHPELRVIYTDAAQDTQRQIADVEMLMGYGIDLLVISPNDSAALRPVISEVYNQIPVIVLDRELEGEDFTLYLAPDNERVGYLAGEMVAQLLDGSGSVVEIVGSESSPPMVERTAGFERAIGEYPGITVEERLQANWLQDQAQDRMKEHVLISSSIPDAVVAQSDDMAYGAHIALDDLQLESVRVLGMGGSNSAALTRRGLLDGSILCPTGGREAVEWVMHILSGEMPEEKRVLLMPEVAPGKTFT